MKTDEEIAAAFKAGMGSSQTAALRAVFELGRKDANDERELMQGRIGSVEGIGYAATERPEPVPEPPEVMYQVPKPHRPKVKKPAAKKRR